MICPYHGAHGDLTNPYAGENDDFYIAKEIYHDGWRKERLALSLYESNITYHYQPLREVFEWLYNNVGELTQIAFVKNAFDKIVLIRHKGKGTRTTCLQVGCKSCGKVCRQLYYADTEENQKMAHRVLWDFLGPYHDIEGRVAFWEQYYREQRQMGFEDWNMVSDQASDSAASSSTLVPSLPSSSSTQSRPQQPLPQPQQHPPGPTRHFCFWENMRLVPALLPEQPRLSLEAPEPSEVPPHHFVIECITRRCPGSQPCPVGPSHFQFEVDEFERITGRRASREEFERITQRCLRQCPWQQQQQQQQQVMSHRWSSRSSSSSNSESISVGRQDL